MELAFHLIDTFLSFAQNTTHTSVQTLYVIILFMLLIIAGLFFTNIAVIILKRIKKGI